jgi:purine-nucleoside phosphorylase
MPQGLVVSRTLPLSAVYPPTATTGQEVAGHAGHAMLGHVDNTPVWVLAGRRHLYQGHNAAFVAHNMVWLKSQGVSRVILTNAAGGINPSYQPGDLMLISDHLNLTGQNPLVASQPDQLVTFTDTSRMYCPEWLAQAQILTGTVNIVTGVYAGMSGPSYETPAEVRMLATLGADAVGMSTVLEALQACALAMPVLGLSLIANPAAGISPSPLTHQDVLSQVQARQAELAVLLGRLLTAGS